MSNGQILLALAERAGFLDDVYRSLNFVWELKDPLTDRQRIRI